MRIKTILIVVIIGVAMISRGQKPSLELTFTAIDSASHIQLDSIKVMNRTQGGDTVLYYPDTVLVLDYSTGIDEVGENAKGLRVDQNYPNPVVESTTISIFVPERGLVRCIVTDIMGRMMYQYDEVLESGKHSFNHTPGGGEMSLFTAQWQNSRETIKILHPNLNQSGSASLSYLGLSSASSYEMKASEAMQGFSFALEDVLLYICYIGGIESGILDTVVVSDTLYFQFATNIPCPGTPTVTYEGQVYNTIQIFSQCWLKENLNVGTMIDSLEDAEDNGIIEKYCYRNSNDSCEKYGGLYQWDEMMNYNSQQGLQGICPLGWHIPSDEEWKVLGGATDSQYRIGNQEWDNEQSRGYDVAKNIKASNGWQMGGNGINLFGFSGLPSGMRSVVGDFEAIGSYTSWWTVSKPYIWIGDYNRCTSSEFSTIYRGWMGKTHGYAVRCIMD